LSADVNYEVEYGNRARVPDSAALMAGWPRDAKTWRDAHPGRWQTIPYGPGVRNVVDFFPGDGNGPIVVFIHGGYWQAFDGSCFSHLAAGLNAHGIDVAIPSYDLCPDVSVGEIVGQMRMAARELAKLGRPLVVSGHSAGGHLAACLLATDWRGFDPSLPAGLVTSAYSISGLFNLVPLVGTSINNALKLDDAAAKQQSPLFWKPPAGRILDAVIGGNESAEYFRQSREIVETWGAAGVTTQFGTVPGANHFTAIAPLADANSPMTLRLKQLAGR
jgi:arylformamidase